MVGICYQYQLPVPIFSQYQLPIVLELVVINTKQGVSGGQPDPLLAWLVNFVTKGLGFLPKFWEVPDPPLIILENL